MAPLDVSSTICGPRTGRRSLDLNFRPSICSPVDVGPRRTAMYGKGCRSSTSSAGHRSHWAMDQGTDVQWTTDRGPSRTDIFVAHWMPVFRPTVRRSLDATPLDVGLLIFGPTGRQSYALWPTGRRSFGQLDVGTRRPVGLRSRSCSTW